MPATQLLLLIVGMSPVEFPGLVVSVFFVLEICLLPSPADLTLLLQLDLQA
jgi:hypothetical protein